MKNHNESRLFWLRCNEEGQEVNKRPNYVNEIKLCVLDEIVERGAVCEAAGFSSRLTILYQIES